MTKHPNSRPVTIMRAESFVDQAQAVTAKEYLLSTNHSIGSYFESRNSHRTASGMEPWEEKLLMPDVLSMDLEDKNFIAEVKDYFISMETPVPYGTGTTLEAGLTESNSEPLSKTNLPIKTEDYIRYRHAMRHPFVASSREQATGNQLKKFYIFDKAENFDKNTKKNEEKDSAYQIFYSIKPSEDKVDFMLTLLGIDPREYGGKNKVSEKVEALRGKLEAGPKHFIDVHDKGDLEIRYWISRMTNKRNNVVKVLLGKYIDVQTDNTLASSEEEFIAFFNDPKYSKDVTRLKAQVQEAEQQSVPEVGQRRTILNTK